jgi:hypothetical protein
LAEGAANDPQCPPTLTIDSGGGLQLIWHLKPAIPAEDNIERAEGIGRTIATRYGGDNTWNADRIMRLPGTVNVPTAAKAKQGRKPATATVLVEYSTDKTYTLAQLEGWAPPSPVAAKARRGTAKASADNVINLPAAGGDNPVDWKVVTAVKTYDELPGDLRRAFREQCRRDGALAALYDKGTLPPGHTDASGSGYSFALARCLKQTGDFTPTQFGQLVWVWRLGPDHQKITARTIWRDWERAATEELWGTPADLWVGDGKPPELPPGVVPEIVERLARDWGRRLGVEPGAPAAALITSLGSLVSAGNTMQLRQKDTGWKVKPILWTAIIGEPGSNKSATIARAIEPVEYVEGRWRGEYAAAAARDKAKAQIDAKAIGGLQRWKTSNPNRSSSQLPRRTRFSTPPTRCSPSQWRLHQNPFLFARR